MLNYVWSGLIIFSLIFALAVDSQELWENRFRNDAALPVTVEFPDGFAPDSRRQPITIQIDTSTYKSFFGVQATPDSSYEGTLVQTKEGRQLRFSTDAELPEPLETIRAFHESEENNALRGTLQGDPFGAGIQWGTASVQFDPVRFRKLNAIAEAALNFAETAASLALGLIGILGLMLGLVKIGEEAGLVHALADVVRPVLRPLFPNVPEGHPALANITLNLMANAFGLGNAATPLGIKAMEDLQDLNPSNEKASDDMVMLLALNTSSVQLVPPSLLVAIMGLQINQLIFSIILATTFSTIAGILGTLALSKMPWFRGSAPHRNASPDSPSSSEGTSAPPSDS
ncbi:MAG: nucleoside recognition protein [Bacteroidetes bacterium QH_7_62_13]|nr:MAG: nucleoside recognition protein [Bacteroidetes bacterium QH_7_62_13]